jgi:ABC-type uncharacterized transport system substrate-binding protein
VVFDERGLAGFRICWEFDEMFSSMIIQDFDGNRNGRFEPGEMKHLKEGAFSNLRNFGYFTHIKISGRPFEVSFVKDFTAEIRGGKLVYNFAVPCHVSAADRFREVRVSIYDHSFYTSVFLVKYPVTLENREAFEVEYTIQKNRAEAYYYGQIYPEEILLRFKRKK